MLNYLVLNLVLVEKSIGRCHSCATAIAVLTILYDTSELIYYLDWLGHFPFEQNVNFNC